MGTTHSARPKWSLPATGRSFDRPVALVALCALLLLAGCTPVRPVVKIGLIAPFEGLYRDSGYTALAALRRAIADCAAPGVDVLPLALDDSADPDLARRAAQKLVADPAVVAIIGPLPFASVPPVAGVMATDDRPWIAPGLVAPAGGFDGPAASAWVVALAEAIIAAQAPARVVVIGLPPTLAPDLPPTVAQTPLLRVDDPATVTPLSGDAALWLAAPDAGADWLAAHPDVPLWLGVPYGGDIWTQRGGAAHTAHWLIWRDREYNDWSQPPAPADPPAYQTYRATCALLAQLGSGRAATAGPWQLSARSLTAAP